MKIPVLLADDEEPARARLRRLLEQEPNIEIVAECASGSEALRLIETLKPRLAFLDIHMPEMHGLDVLESLPEKDPPLIIFVTAFDEYAVSAFEAQALDYLLKPVHPERLQRALMNAEKRLALLEQRPQRAVPIHAAEKSKALDRIAVKSEGKIVIIRTSDISWIQASGNYLKLHVGAQSYLVRETMKSMEQKLNPLRFLRIHRSTIVNVDKIKHVQPWFGGEYQVLLNDGTKLTLSRHFRHHFDALIQRLS